MESNFHCINFCIICIISIAAIPSIPDVIQARKFEVVNSMGDPVVVLSNDNNGGTITVNNSFKTPIVNIGGNSYGYGTLKIQNDAAKTVVSAGGFQNGGIISISNNQGVSVLNASPDKDGKGALSIYDNLGNLTWSPISSTENK